MKFALEILNLQVKSLINRWIHRTSPMKQIRSSIAEFAGKKRQTRRERFLTDMEKVVVWTAFLKIIEPYYLRGQRGRPPIGLD